MAQSPPKSCSVSPAAALFLAVLFIPQVLSTNVTPFLPQGFFFDWTPQGQAVPVPTTGQCDKIHIVWERGNAQGPSPTAPYYLQVYTSTFVVPFVIDAGNALEFDWVVPFIPGTQYQICMFDSNGVSGGCQATYTVYPAPNTTINNPPTCFNLTYPQTTLGVSAIASDGPLSEYGWIDQCTDISVTPKNGTPPYTLTVAPALHPPYNITSHTMDPVNWTVSLSYGMPFFISMVDSTGLGWANGPLHSAAGGTTRCLLLDNTSEKTSIAPAVAIGSGIGGLVLGLAIGLLGTICFFRSRRRNELRLGKGSGMSVTSSPGIRTNIRDLPSMSTDNSRDGLLRDASYHVEPFVLPAEREFGARPTTRPTTANTVLSSSDRSPSVSWPDSQTRPISHSHTTSIPQSPTSQPSEPSDGSGSALVPPPPLQQQERSASQVYVVHHDGGRAPVTVYTADGTEVVELPPRYIDSGPSTPNEGAVTSASTRIPPRLQQRRQTGSLPDKPIAAPSRRVAN